VLAEFNPELSISVVIPVYNGGEAFRACVASVAAALRISDEIIVVADGESDGSWRIAAEYGATVLKLEQNGGPARARNHGAKAATRDIVFFVDADVTIRPNSLDLVAATFGKRMDIAAMIGSYDRIPHHSNFLSQYKNLLHHYVHQNGSAKASTFWGACGAIRREIFLYIGGFNERYTRASIEDIELGYRLIAANHAIHLEKNLQVTHLKRWTVSSLLNAEIFLRGTPWTRLLWWNLWRSRKVPADLNLDMKHRLSMLLSAVMVGVFLAGLANSKALLLVVPLFAVFLGLNGSVLRFFYINRGFLFTGGAAIWRFFYDLYCWVGFFVGSSRTAHGALRRLALFTFSKLDAVSLGIAVGLTSAFVVAIATGAVLLSGDAALNRSLSLLGNYLIGYRVSGAGLLVGTLQTIVLGYLFGFSFAVIRNFSVRIAMGSDKVRLAFVRLMNKERH